MNIQMVDLKSQYLRIKDEIDTAILECVEATRYIKGPQVVSFEEALGSYLEVKHTIGCGNGTDALQIAFMALGLKPGDEIIVPAFTYASTVEAIAILGLSPVIVDVDRDSFNISIEEIEKAITKKTKVIVPVHLYGQSADMEPILQLAIKYGLCVVEDNAQALGAEYIFSNGKTQKTGTIGHIGCTSFFPTKNLGCFGDGGALTTNNPILAEKCRMIAAHGQKRKYHHSVIGCNSRLDTIQAAVLGVKLQYLDEYLSKRKKSAAYYHNELSGINGIILPECSRYAIHTFNQFTLQIKDGRRDRMQAYLKENGIPSTIYYPLPLHKQEAFAKYWKNSMRLTNSENLCSSVISLPMHTELTESIQNKVIQTIRNFK